MNKKIKCTHVRDTGDSAYEDTLPTPRGMIYLRCALCGDLKYAPGMAPVNAKDSAIATPQKKRAKQAAQPALIALDAPTRFNTMLPDEITVHHGPNLGYLQTLPDNCLDGCVTDPPSGIAFMGKSWDKSKGGRDAWIAERETEFTELLRCLKPGAHALVWALPRTSHWTATALENAGFLIRDITHHIFGSGYPKSLNIGKQLDKEAGAERTVIGSVSNKGRATPIHGGGMNTASKFDLLTAAATPDAERYEGYGTALKPAVEHWIMVQKPISEKTIAANVLRWGVGGLNIGGTRVGKATIHTSGLRNGTGTSLELANYTSPDGYSGNDHAGRWPAHLVFSHTPDCQQVGEKRIKASVSPDHDTPDAPRVYGAFKMRHGAKIGDAQGMETISVWDCAAGCPIAELDAQSGTRKSGTETADGFKRSSTLNQENAWAGIRKNEDAGTLYGDEGGASRYFTQLEPSAEAVLFHYFGKPAQSQRERGLVDMAERTGQEITGRLPESAGTKSGRAGTGYNGAKNFHPTVKSLELMKWLITLIMPPKTAEYTPILIDMFAGSGTTGVAALQLGYRAILCEMDADNEGYIDLIYARLADARQRQTGRIAA